LSYNATATAALAAYNRIISRSIRVTPGKGPLGRFRCFVKHHHSRVFASISKRRDFSIRITFVIVGATKDISSTTDPFFVNS
jgi:hypothetical protein